jgi:NADH:ubiquinone oxidoreductase subunit 3 (subunit A)
MTLLAPPAAFLIYLALAAILYAFGRLLAGPEKPGALKSSLYSSGEEHSTTTSAPGYQPFFLIALFFAILHLGVLMLGTGGVSWMSAIYLLGLFLVLVALILG